MPDDLLIPQDAAALTRAKAVAAFQRWLEQNDDAEYARFTFTIAHGQVQVQTRHGVTFERYVVEAPTSEQPEVGGGNDG